MIYFYGGSFDPVSNAHLDILKTICKKLRPADMLMVGVANNDEKNYKATINHRIQLVQDLVNEKLQKYNIRVINQEYRTYKFLQDYIAQTGVTKNDFTICVGEDEWISLCAGKWVNYELLLKNFKFIVINRDSNNELKAPKGFNTDIKTIQANIEQGISSSKVRDILSRNPECHYEDVKTYITHHTFRYIKENELYWQNGYDYEKNEKQFLIEYAKKKKENNWGEPSVTTDIVAYNGDEILLIRRGNYPYKRFWCTPGGFFEKTDEDLCYGAARELKEETCLDLDPTKFVQIKTYGHNFDPRMKIVDVAFAIRVPKNLMKKANGSDDATEARWFNINDLPRLGFHHAQIIEDWLKTRND